MSEFVVELEGITQKFGEFVALENVSLRVMKGSMHAIVGENGAGKTTLMKVLYGQLRPTQGSLKVRGTPRSYTSAKEALADGIGMVSQHYAIIPELTCLQNLMLGAEPGSVLNAKSNERRATELATKMGFRFDWNAPASKLGPAESQQLEILKLLWRDASILILDEPTAMLSPADAEALFENLHALTNEGATVLLVTHRLPEVMDHCERVTVLRGGKHIADKETHEVNPNQLAELIVGHGLTEIPARQPIEGATLLAVDRCTVKGYRGDEAVKNVSFQIKKGELVGLAGVDGSGQRELFQMLIGVIPAVSGAVSLDGNDLIPKTTQQRLAMGIRLIAEDRHAEAMIDAWTMIENAALGFQRDPEFMDGIQLNRTRLAEKAKAFAERFNTRHPGLDQPLASLSGGNQQRFVAARALSGSPKLVLAFQPARGLDIDATRNVYGGIREACENGGSALVVSFDVDELLQFCDRILVMNGGVLEESPSLDRTVIGQLMVGANRAS